MADKPIFRFHARDVRLAFPNLATAGKFGYGARLIIPPEHTQVLNKASRAYLDNLDIKQWRANPTVKDDKAVVKLPTDMKAKVKTLPLLRAIAEAVAAKKWAEKSKAVVAGLVGQDKLFYHDGDTKAELDGFEGNWFIACGSKGPVSIFLADTTEGTAKDAYSGCYGHGIIDVWAQDNTDGGKRVNASIYGFQKIRDGDAFSAGAPPATADEIEAEDISDEGGEEGEEDLTA